MNICIFRNKDFAWPRNANESGSLWGKELSYSSFICRSAGPSVAMHLSFCQSICLSVCLPASVHLSSYLSLCLPLYSVHPSIDLSIDPWIHQSIPPSVLDPIPDSVSTSIQVPTSLNILSYYVFYPSHPSTPSTAHPPIHPVIHPPMYQCTCRFTCLPASIYIYPFVRLSNQFQPSTVPTYRWLS